MIWFDARINYFCSRLTSKKSNLQQTKLFTVLNWFKNKLSQFFTAKEPDPMKYLIVGLGNMGYDYDDTRHNIGFDVIDALANEYELTYKHVTLGDMAEFKYKGKTFVLLKPSTFMNLSGKAVNYWMQKHKIPQSNILIILDDLNLPFGKQRIKGKGSDGGHNGLKDINRVLGNQNYTRLRLGIGNDYHKGQQANFVLGKWSKEERAILPQIIKTAAETSKAFVTIGLKFTMEQFNNKNNANGGSGNQLVDKIGTNPANQSIFPFFKLNPKNIKLEKWQRNGQPEGSVQLLSKLGKKIPKKTKYSIGNLSVLLNEQNGEIFAIYSNRFNSLVKPSFENLNLENSDSLRKGQTSEGDIDINALGENWILLDNVNADMQEQVLMSAYQLTKK